MIKKQFFFLVGAFLAMFYASAAYAQTYIVTVGEQVTAAADVEDNGLYGLYNVRNDKWMYEDSSNKLLLLGGLGFDGLNGSTTTNSIFRLISNGDGTYKVQAYDTGRYLPVPTGNQNISTSETAGSYDLNFQGDGNIFPRSTNNGTTYGLDHTSGGVYTYTNVNTNNGSAQNYRLYKMTLTEYVEPEGVSVITLNNTNTYRGALIYNPSASEKWVWSSGKSGTFSSTDANSQWVLYPTGDPMEYYLYSLGAKKFAVPTTGGTYGGYSWMFSHDAVALKLSEQSDGTYKIFTATGDLCVSVSNNYEGPIINYNDVGAQFTMTKLAEITDAQEQEIKAAIGNLVHNTTPLTALPSGDGWYAVRIKTHGTYPDYFVFAPEDEINYNGTSYALNFYDAAKVRPAIDDATYYFRLTQDGSGYDWQMPNGRFLHNNSNKFPVSTETATAIGVDYSANGFRFYHNARYAVPYLLSGSYFIGETSSTGNAYYDIYPINLNAAGLVAWQVVCDDAPASAQVTCSRNDVSGLTSVYKNGYFFFPTGVTPSADDFFLPGGTSITVDAAAHTITIAYDPTLAIVAEGVEVHQGYGTTGVGNEKAVLLRMQFSPFNAMENATMSFTLTNPANIAAITVYETGNNVEFNAIGTYTNTFTGTIDGNNATVPLGTVTAGTHYLWLCATIADDATVGDVIDAALTGVSYDYNGYTGTTCDLSAVGNPDRDMKIFDVESRPFLPTTYNSNVYRIPGMTVANDGSIVVAADKRYNSYTDIGGGHVIDIVVRRSTDGGKTWSEPVTVAKGQGTADDAKCGYGDPSLTKGKDGKLYCLFAAGNTGYFYGLNRICMSTSTDNGVTWTEPVDLYETGRITDHTQYGLFDYFVTSGKGLYTSDGILMYLLPAQCYTNAEKTAHISNSNDYVFYSTDDGATWHISEEIVFEGGDEAKIEQAEDGSLIASIRRAGTRGFNFGTYTKNNDGTVSFNWGTQSLNAALYQQSANNQDILYYSKPSEGADILIHSMTTGSHANLKLYMSIDQGKTWNEVYQVQVGGSRYVTMTKTDKGDLALLFEDFSLEVGNQYPINFLTLTKEQVLSWYEALEEKVNSPDVKNSLQGSATGCDSWGSFTNASGGWYSTWTSNDASGKAGVTVVASGNDFNYANVYGQRCMAMRPSSAGATDEITITAPEGFYIDSYTIGGRNYSGSQSYKLIAPDGAEVSTTTGTVNAITVENVNNTTSTFKFYGSSTSNYLCITNFIIKLKSYYTVNLNAVGEASWATLYVPFDLTAADNTKAYYIKQVEGDMAHLIEIEEGNIPANTAVVLMNGDVATKAKFAVGKDLESVVTPEENLLKGTLTTMQLDLGDDSPYYSLGRKDGEIGFYKFENNGTTTITLGANKAYLDTTSPSSSAKGFRLSFDSVNGIDTIMQAEDGRIQGIYNVAGQRVSVPTKGLYIVNGKKVVVNN